MYRIMGLLKAIMIFSLIYGFIASEGSMCLLTEKPKNGFLDMVSTTVGNAVDSGNLGPVNDIIDKYLGDDPEIINSKEYGYKIYPVTIDNVRDDLTFTVQKGDVVYDVKLYGVKPAGDVTGIESAIESMNISIQKVYLDSNGIDHVNMWYNKDGKKKDFTKWLIKKGYAVEN